MTQSQYNKVRLASFNKSKVLSGNRIQYQTPIFKGTRKMDEEDMLCEKEQPKRDNYYVAGEILRKENLDKNDFANLVALYREENGLDSNPESDFDSEYSVDNKAFKDWLNAVMEKAGKKADKLGNIRFLVNEVKGSVSEEELEKIDEIYRRKGLYEKELSESHDKHWFSDEELERTKKEIFDLHNKQSEFLEDLMKQAHEKRIPDNAVMRDFIAIYNGLEHLKQHYLDVYFMEKTHSQAISENAKSGIYSGFSVLQDAAIVKGLYTTLGRD